MNQTIKVDEAMEISEVSRTTIWTWLKQNKFSYSKKANGRILINKESFIKFINEKIIEYVNE